MADGAERTDHALDIDALEAVSAAVESGAGLPEVVRAAARALDASLALIDRSSAVLAVAAGGVGDERSLLRAGAGVRSVELRVGDVEVGQLRVRTRGEPPPAALLRLVAALLAAEVDRVRAPVHASRDAVVAFLRAVFRREVRDGADIAARARELGLELGDGGSVVVARAHPRIPTDDDWRARLRTVVERATRAVAPAAIAAPIAREGAHGAEILVLVPDPSAEAIVKVATAIGRELDTSLQGFGFAVGRSRSAANPGDLHRAMNEAVLAANVAEAAGVPERGFEETGAYRLLLSAMIEDPDELRRFYTETIEPLVAYDDQYDTELVRTVDTYLDADGNVAGTASRLFTHRHTIRYRLERVRELSGHDVSSSEGREKLSLGLKAMRVLGIPRPGGPATEAGAEGGRVPRESPTDRRRGSR